MSINLVPSILAANFCNLGDDIETMAKCGIKTLHLDIMDGHFVPNLTFGPEQIRQLSMVIPTMNLDAHLMVSDADALLERLADAGVNSVTVHAEACIHLYRMLMKIKGLGMKAGVALNPATPFTQLLYVAEAGLLDKVLLMTVEPGFGGQTYIPISTKKIRELSNWRREFGFDFVIQVDGGITIDNVEIVVEAGASEIVIGSSIFKNREIQKNINDFSHRLQLNLMGERV
jgi:ribulose-phosphate 3-epimerase